MKTLLLLITLFVISPVSFANMDDKQTTSNAVSQNVSDKKLAGMLRSTIAFERHLSNRKIIIQVRDAVVTVSGKLSTKREHDLLISIINLTVGSKVQVSIQGLVLNFKQTKLRT
ncbi:MAG: osmotically-inducible protein OsmY [Paraglaciecola sp.]|jgi:osmotically-inducible protein OsmY